MSFRSHFSKNREQDHRSDHRPYYQHARGKHPHVRGHPQFNKSQKFFSKTLSCKRQPLRLFCPHCHTRCVKFQDYQEHLHLPKHQAAIGKLIQRIERQVDLNRQEQQKIQAAADKDAQAQEGSSAVVKYCEVCDLHFYQEERKHVASQYHVILQKILKPRCNICSYQATDFVVYEHHICSLEHLKREENWTGEMKSSEQFDPSQQGASHIERQASSSRGASGNIKSDSSPDTSSPGIMKSESSPVTSSPGNIKSQSGDDMITGESGKDRAPTRTGEQVAEKDKSSVITKVEALHCSCCKVLFSCEGDPKAATVKHCGTMEHHRMWVKYVEENHKAELAAAKNSPKQEP